MKIFSSKKVREIDAFTIKNEPVNSINLMERAAEAFTKLFIDLFDKSKPVFVFCGPGNNGGDGFAIARMLKESNYDVTVILISVNDNLSKDCEINMNRFLELEGNKFLQALSKEHFPVIEKNHIVIDAIFGSGLSRPAEGLTALAIHHINSSGAHIVAVDIPSGLFGEDNRDNIFENVIHADYTISFQFPFLSFFFAEYQKYTGQWQVLDIGLHKDAIENTESKYQLLTSHMIAGILHKREKFSHKGSYGHALIISGCYGMMGAAVLTTRSCLRAGAGLVTSHIPRFGYNILQTAVPEALISIDQSDIIFSEAPDLKIFDAIGVGPGLSCKTNSGKGIYNLLTRVDKPLVIDADAINILAKNPEWMTFLPENTIITPHPKEFDRLAGESRTMYDRHQKQLEFASKYKIIVVLKGAHTIISAPDGNSWINTTGNPGMASGGSGDVLTGIIVSLLAQSYLPLEAAITGVFIHGLSADLALDEQSEESLLASDIIEHLGKAFIKIRSDNK